MIRGAKRYRVAARRWSWAGPKLRKVILDSYVREPVSREWTSVTSELKLNRLVRKDFLHIAEARGQMEAATGITRVDPLMDDELVTLVASFPQEMLLFGNRRRGLFRHAMRGMLPEALRLRPDKARFEPALAEMVQGSDLAALRELASMRMLGELGLVDPVRYRRHFEMLLSDGVASSDWLAVWPALAVEAFVRAQWDARES
jgi:hypothetical protein